MGDINKMEEECTHNCMTCGHGCAEGSDGVGKFEKALNKLSDIDAGGAVERITVAGRIRQSIIENDKKKAPYEIT